MDNIPALFQIMAWCRPGDKPLSEAMMVSLLTHICVAWPQWVKLRNTTCPRQHGTDIMEAAFKFNAFWEKFCSILYIRILEGLGYSGNGISLWIEFENNTIKITNTFLGGQLTHWGWEKWPPFRIHFLTHCLVWKLLYFDSNWTEICSLELN